MGTKLLFLFFAFVISALFIALISAATTIRAQHRRIEKHEDEYEGQSSINHACAGRHKAEKRKLEQEKAVLAAENSQFRVERDIAPEAKVKHQRRLDSAACAAAEARCRMAGGSRLHASRQRHFQSAAGA
jgi:hypothetical protein